MGARVAHRSFHAFGDVDDLAHLRVGVVDLFELFYFFCFGNGRATRGERNELGNLIHFGQRNFHYTCHITNGSFGAHRTEGDDLCHFIVAVFARAIFEHLMAAVVAEVEVDIGHRHASRIQEAFKDERMLKRVHHCDAKRVRDDGACRRTARVVPNAMIAGEGTQVPHDEEVGIEAHAVDDA